MLLLVFFLSFTGLPQSSEQHFLAPKTQISPELSSFESPHEWLIELVKGDAHAKINSSRQKEIARMILEMESDKELLNPEFLKLVIEDMLETVPFLNLTQEEVEKAKDLSNRITTSYIKMYFIYMSGSLNWFYNALKNAYKTIFFKGFFPIMVFFMVTLWSFLGFVKALFVVSLLFLAPALLIFIYMPFSYSLQFLATLALLSTEGGRYSKRKRYIFINPQGVIFKSKIKKASSLVKIPLRLTKLGNILHEILHGIPQHTELFFNDVIGYYYLGIIEKELDQKKSIFSLGPQVPNEESIILQMGDWIQLEPMRAKDSIRIFRDEMDAFFMNEIKDPNQIDRNKNQIFFSGSKNAETVEPYDINKILALAFKTEHDVLMALGYSKEEANNEVVAHMRALLPLIAIANANKRKKAQSKDMFLEDITQPSAAVEAFL